MRTPERQRGAGLWQIGVAASAAALMLAITVAALPAFHGAIHADAAAPQHQCALSFIQSGHVDLQHSDMSGSILPDQRPFQTLLPRSIAHRPAAFLASRIFEHAPPAYA